MNELFTVTVTEARRPGRSGSAARPRSEPEKVAEVSTEGFSLEIDGRRILRDISVTFFKNTVTALIGPSGSGKSMLLRSLNRMNDHLPGIGFAGSVDFAGRGIYSADTDVANLRSMIGMVFQRPNPFPKSIFENVAYGPKVHGLRDRRQLAQVVERSLRRAALWDEVKDRLQQSAFELSGGQQQRLCIARSLAVDPQVLLMDEPCSALDPAATQRIEDLVEELKKEVTVVIATHNLQQAARISDFVVFVLAGELVEFGRTSEVFTAPKDPRTNQYITGRFG
jgi:phosphate transport system ATP-binding protein